MSDIEQRMYEPNVCGCDYGGRCTIDHATGQPTTEDRECSMCGSILYDGEGYLYPDLCCGDCTITKRLASERERIIRVIETHRNTEDIYTDAWKVLHYLRAEIIREMPEEERKLYYDY